VKSILNDFPAGGLPQLPIIPQALLTSSAMRASDGRFSHPENVTKPEASTETVTPQEPAEAIEEPSAARMSFQA